MTIFDFKSTIEEISGSSELNEFNSGETFLLEISTGKLLVFDEFKQRDDVIVLDEVNFSEDKTSKKFNLFKFGFDRFKVHTSRKKYELTFKKDKYILINIMSMAMVKFGHQIIKNIWNLRYQDIDVQVTSNFSLLEYLVMKFEDEKSLDLNEIHINNGIFKEVLEGKDAI